jgi:hypothetical protein
MISLQSPSGTPGPPSQNLSRYSRHSGWAGHGQRAGVHVGFFGVDGQEGERGRTGTPVFDVHALVPGFDEGELRDAADDLALDFRRGGAFGRFGADDAEVLPDVVADQLLWFKNLVLKLAGYVAKSQTSLAADLAFATGGSRGE